MKKFITLNCNAVSFALRMIFPETHSLLKLRAVLLFQINKIRYAFLITSVIILSSLGTFSQASYPNLSFKNSTLYSGTALMQNAVYKFTNVTTGVDAFVKVDSLLNGATLSDIDQFGGVGYDDAFQPIVNSAAPSPASYVKFTIDFKKTDGSVHTFPTLALTGLDIDGTTLNLLEYCIIDMGSGGIALYQLTTPEIAISYVGTGFKAQNIAGNNISGIDSTRKEVMYTVKNAFVSSLTIKFGNVRTSGSGNRNYAALFADFVYPFPHVLPFEIISFNAVNNNSTVNLYWVTDHEVNSDHFEVERSFDMNDFKTIGLVLDGFPVNGSSEKTYQFKDNSKDLKGQGIAYYRLKQVDKDGQFTYSKIISVNLHENTSVKMQVSPNPFVENLNVRFTADQTGTAQIKIINMTGQTVLSNHFIINKGQNTIQIDGLNRLSNGIYMARLIMNEKMIDNQKIIK